MRPIKDVIELHGIVMEIALTFHSICEKNNIPYYMLGGTMLGAIRHKGFIPWDDDMDFGIPRSFFSKAIMILREQLPSYYRIKDISDNVGIFGEIVKIEDTRTLIVEQYREGYETGVFIDIFPLDAANNNYSKFSRNMIIQRFLHAQQIVMSNSPKNIGGKICIAISKCFGKFVFHKVLRYIVRTNGDYVANYSGMWGAKETVKKDVFGEGDLYQFEDTYFRGVSRPHEYLTSLYGDYMKLPPEDQRHTHIIEMYYR